MAGALTGRDLPGTSVGLGGRGEEPGKWLTEPRRYGRFGPLGSRLACHRHRDRGQVLGAAWGQPRVLVYRGDLLAPSSEPVLMAALAALHSVCKLVVKQSILLSPGACREN